MKFKPRMLIPIVVIGALAGGGAILEAKRAETRSELSGFFEGRTTEVSARVAGRVSSLDALEGDLVEAGELVANLDAAPATLDAEALLRQADQAAAQLALAEDGARTERIVAQEAVVAEARASLAKLVNGARPEEIALAEERLAEARARLAAAENGPRPQEIAAARSAYRRAQAAAAAARRGPTPQELAQAEAALRSARAAHDNARSQALRSSRLLVEGAVSERQAQADATAERTARAAMDQAEEALRRARLGTPAEELRQAVEAENEARARLDLVLAGSRPEDIQAARATAAQAEAQLLQLRNGSRNEDIDAAHARLAQAESVLAELRNGERPEALAALRAAEGAARLRAAGAAAVTDERRIVAPRAGRIESLLVAVGDLIQPGQPVARLVDPNDIWLTVYVPESRLAEVQVGDPAELRVDGVAEPIAARVESIAPRGEFTPANLQTTEERGKQVFGVRLRLAEADTRVKQGMFASVIRLGAPR